MTGYTRKCIISIINITIAIFFLSTATAFALQEKVSPLSDYQYKKDFAQYETIKKEADPQKQAELLAGYLKSRPISKLLFNVTNDYIKCLNPFIQKQDWPKVISMAEAFQALVPTQKAVEAEGIPVGVEEFLKTHLVPSHATLLELLMQVYGLSGNLPKAAENGEKLFELTQNNNVLLALADIYLKMQNIDKYMALGDKILAAFPMDQPQGYRTALQMAQIYLQKDTAKATELLSKVMDVYGDKVPAGVKEAEWNATRAFSYGMIANGFYTKKDFPKAIELFDKAVSYDPKKEDAHYFLGMCKWNGKDQKGAIESFARVVVLGKSYAQKAQQNLENLYKAEHNNSLDGLDQVLAKAKSELGLK